MGAPPQTSPLPFFPEMMMLTCHDVMRVLSVVGVAGGESAWACLHVLRLLLLPCPCLCSVTLSYG